MARHATAALRTDDVAPRHEPTQMYPQDLEGSIQQALATLADLEMRYEQEQERLDAWTAPAAQKERIAAQLAESHRRDREPYVHLLAELHQRVVALNVFGRRALH